MAGDEETGARVVSTLAGAGSVDERIVAVIARVLKQPHSSSDFGMDAYLSDLGLDSIKVIELLLEIEGEFDLTLPDEFLVADTFRTAASLKAAVLAAGGPRS
jgi:acyl carrier protein